MQVVMTFKLKKKSFALYFVGGYHCVKLRKTGQEHKSLAAKRKCQEAVELNPTIYSTPAAPLPDRGPGRSTLAYSFTAFAATTERTSRPASINLALEGIDKQTKRTHAVRGLGKLMTSLAGRLQNLPFTALPLHG